ncbi:alpha/beta fold hydrolase [Kutzneria sp. 744]|uniref:alpha/beta fold hydrolase n=1 Tax=Kutzneria sp. (strain 744) TaxID=345341 RepID=UPI0005BA209B|nr:alpha/beta hydrolase [Kutzneria sp. 744]
MSQVEIVLVHGAWHGSWCWEPLRVELAALGRRSHAVDLPSASGPAFGVDADAKVVRETVDSVSGSVLLLGHSYGGIPVSQAAAGAQNIARLVYLAAFQLDEGASLLSSVGAELPADQESVPLGDDTIDRFYADVPADLARDAVSRLRPHSAQSWRDEQSAAGWRDIPSTYVLCEQDKAIRVEFQAELARRADEVRRLDAGHSPFLSMPAELAAMLDEIASAADDAS